MRFAKITLSALFITLSLQNVSAQRQKRKVDVKKNVIKEKKFELTEENQKFVNKYGVVRCATVENEEILKSRNSNRYSTKQFEEWLAPLVAKEREKQKLSGRFEEEINIPVVVHVIHNGDAVNTAATVVKSEHISFAQAKSQVDVLNEDFRRIQGTRGGANTSGKAVDTKINFVLAKVDPNGQPTTGIIFHNINPPNNTTPSVNDDWETRANIENMKANTIWDSSKYMNMWSLKMGGLSSQQGGMQGTLGYAQFPSSSGLPGFDDDEGEGSTDGVVSGYQFFGTDDADDGSFVINGTYNKGRTMTHEVGHFLGLRHIWGDTTSCTNDDFCADTPDATQSNGGCNKNADSCPNDGLGRDMVENYMDYTDDSCMDTFTADQTLRMVTVLKNSPRRAGLTTSVVAEDPGAIIAFNTAYTDVREGTSCSYTDYEYSVTISEAPTANANVSIVASGTANSSDFEILNGDMTFTQGSAASKTFTLRLYNDAVVENEEQINLNFALNANGGNARIINNAAKELLIKVTDNDSEITAFDQDKVIFSDDFSDGDASDWQILDNNSEVADDWNIVEEANWPQPFGLYTDYFLASYSWDGVAYSPDNFASTPKITLSANATNIELSYFIGSGNDDNAYQENYEVWVSTSIASASSIMAGTRVADENLSDFLTQHGAATRTADLSAFAGQEIYISFRHHDTTNQWILALDNVQVTADEETQVQSSVNTIAPSELPVIGVNKMIAVSNDNSVITEIDNKTAFDFGCVSAAVMRAGSGSQAYVDTNVADAVSDKVFQLTSVNDTESGEVVLGFYLTKAELEGWETASGLSRNDLHIHRYDGGQTKESVQATITAFGTNAFKVSGTFKGIEGQYYFGDSKTLSTSENEIDNFAVYPNPSNGSFNIRLNSLEKVNVDVFDLRGRKMFTQKFDTNGFGFNKQVNVSSLSSGVYLLKVTSGGKQSTRRILIK